MDVIVLTSQQEPEPPPASLLDEDSFLAGCTSLSTDSTHDTKFISIVDVPPSSESPDEGDDGFRTPTGELSDLPPDDEDEPQPPNPVNGNNSVTIIQVVDSSRSPLDRSRSEDSDTQSSPWNNGSFEETPITNGNGSVIVQFLGSSTDGAEARLAAKRQARAEAREIRMRELERQQKEAEESSDKIYDLYTNNEDDISSVTDDKLDDDDVDSDGVIRPPRVVNSTRHNNSYQSSRRSSEDSLDESVSLRDVRHELREAEDKFRKAMIGNAQLDNEKAAVVYQVELYKDRYEELEESHAQLMREYKDKCRALEQLKRDSNKLEQDLVCTRAALEERDRLIEEQGLVIVGGDTSSSGEESDGDGRDVRDSRAKHKRALVSSESANLLASAGKGSLDVRLKKLAAERNDLQDELRHVKLELEEERSKARSGSSAGDLEDIQREANKQLGEYKFKLQKAEQDVSTLQATVARLEGQVARYKTSAEASEKLEDELKSDRRKLQRELREALARLEELETSHSHLQKRMEKLKNAKSALLKDL